MSSAPLSFWAVNPSRCFLCPYTPHSFISLDCCIPFLHLCFLFRCVWHPLSLPLSSCLGCIPPLIGLPLLRSLPRSVLCGCLLIVSSVCAFVCVFCFLLIHFYFYFCLFCVPSCMATIMSFAWYFLSCPFSSVCFPCFFSPNVFPV